MDKPFLVAVDFSPLTERCVSKASQFASGGGNAIDLLHVLKPPTVAARGNHAARQIAEQAMRDQTEAARRKLEEHMQAIPEALRGNCLVEVGIPADVICRLAEDYDLAVLATNGRTGLSHALLGSVAERVVRFCPSPVLVVR